MKVDASELQNIHDFENRYGVKFIRAHLLGDGTAEVECFKVASNAWYVDVWNCQAHVMLDLEDEPVCIDDDVDKALLERLIEKVVYEDYGSAVNISGRYYPLSNESNELFLMLLASKRTKQ